MSKYKAGDKVVVDIKDTYLSAYGVETLLGTFCFRLHLTI